MSFRGDLPFYSPTGIYPALTRRIIELATPALVLKQLLIDLPLEAGASVDVPRESGTRVVYLKEKAEGAEIVFDTTPYDRVSVTPVTYGVADYVTREMLEDVQPLLPLVDTKIRRLARKFAMTVEKAILDVIEAGAGSTVSATGKSLFYTGSEITLANTVGQYDILQAKTNIEQQNLMPEFLVTSPSRLMDIVKLPHFSSSLHYGESVNMTGVVGEIYGLSVLVSAIVPTNRVYVVGAGKNVSGAYAPLGFLVWKRPITIETEYEKKRQVHNIYLTTRFSPVITEPANIAKITVGS